MESTTTSSEPELPPELQSIGAWMLYNRGHRSKADVARAMGCTGQLVGLIEEGKRNLTFPLAVRVALFFNTNPWQLLAHFDLMDRDVLEMLGGQPVPDPFPAPRGAPNG